MSRQLGDDCKHSSQCPTHVYLHSAAQQELQEKNAQLLAVTRQLGQDAERDKAQLRSDLEAESAERATRLASQIAQQREERLRQEVSRGVSHATYNACPAPSPAG